MAHDEVNNPKHYTSGGIECIDAIQSSLTPEEFRGFLKGNILKYTWRERHKGGNQSMEKAQWYLNRLLSKRDISPLPVLNTRRQGDLPTTLGESLGLRNPDELDAYDKIEAHHFQRGMS